jgi:hypothetical protein
MPEPEEISFKDEVSRLKNADPFVPFRIVMASGDKYEVSNPDLLAIGASVIHLFHRNSNAYDILRVNQITSTEVLEPAA